MRLYPAHIAAQILNVGPDELVELHQDGHLPRLIYSDDELMVDSEALLSCLVAQGLPEPIARVMAERWMLPPSNKSQ